MVLRVRSCISQLNQFLMREWLSGGVSPCQGEGRGFESRLVLFSYPESLNDRKRMDCRWLPDMQVLLAFFIVKYIFVNDKTKSEKSSELYKK